MRLGHSRLVSRLVRCVPGRTSSGFYRSPPERYVAVQWEANTRLLVAGHISIEAAVMDFFAFNIGIYSVGIFVVV